MADSASPESPGLTPQALPGDSSETLLRPVGIDGLHLPGLHSSVPPEPLRLAAMPSHSSPFCCPETGSCGSCPRTARRLARTSLRVSALSGSTPGNAFAPRRQLSSALSAMPSRLSPFCCPETGSFGPASGQRVGGLGHRLRALRCCLCFAPGNGGSDAWRFYCRSFSVQLFARPSPGCGRIGWPKHDNCGALGILPKTGLASCWACACAPIAARKPANTRINPGLSASQG